MYQIYVTNQHLGRFYKYTHSCAAYEPSFYFKLGHCPMTLHYYTFKSKSLVKKVSIDEEQCLRMGRVHIQDYPRTMAQFLRNPMRNNIRLRSRVGTKVEIHWTLLLHSISMQCTQSLELCLSWTVYRMCALQKNDRLIINLLYHTIN